MAHTWEQPEAGLTRWEARARALDDMAKWCEQPDIPTGMQGLVTSQDLRLRAAAIRAEGEAFGDPELSARVTEVVDATDEWRDTLISERDEARAEVARLRAGTSMMDRPAYELVQRLQAELDDADQMIDTPHRPNTIYVWAVRELLEDYGGRRHRWSHQRCFECGHSAGWHVHGSCFCGCVMTQAEVIAGKRDEELDDDIERGLRE